MSIFGVLCFVFLVVLNTNGEAAMEMPVWTIRFEDQQSTALVGKNVSVLQERQERLVGLPATKPRDFVDWPEQFNTAMIPYRSDIGRLTALVLAAESLGLRPVVELGLHAEPPGDFGQCETLAGKLYGVVVPLPRLFTATEDGIHYVVHLREWFPGTRIIASAGVYTGDKTSLEKVQDLLTRARGEKVSFDVAAVEIGTISNLGGITRLLDEFPDTPFCLFNVPTESGDDLVDLLVSPAVTGVIFAARVVPQDVAKALFSFEPVAGFSDSSGNFRFSAPFGYYTIRIEGHHFFPYLGYDMPRDQVLRIPPTPSPPTSFEMPFDPQSPQAWQERLRGKLEELVEKQNPRGDYPLEIKQGEDIARAQYMERTLSFTGNEGKPIEATLTVPSGEGPFPAVICLHGHGGSREMTHDKTSIYKGFAAEFASRGFVTLAPSLWHCPYASDQLWNLMRLVDVLETFSFVDRSRIGCAGLSMGGEWTMWLAAMDKRVKAAVVSGWLCTTEGTLSIFNCPCWMTPGLLEVCDICEVHLLIAPRPLLFESAVADGCFPISRAREAYRKVANGYKIFHAQEAVRQHCFEGGHAWNGALAYRFMEKALNTP